MSTVGPVVREHAWLPVPCAAGSGILRGLFVAITAGQAVIATSAGAAVAVATSDADDDRGNVDVAFRCSGATVRLTTTTALVVPAGSLLASDGTGKAALWTAGVINAVAVDSAQNGTVEAVLV